MSEKLQEIELLNKIARIAGLINRQKTTSSRKKPQYFPRFAPQPKFKNKSFINPRNATPLTTTKSPEFIKKGKHKLVRKASLNKTKSSPFKPTISIKKISAQKLSTLKKNAFIPKSLTINGVTFVRAPNGRSLIRKNTTTKQLASQRIKKSLKTVQQPKKNKIQYCLFYTKFGKCNRINECKYIHDPNKVAICRRFLKGECTDTNCLLQHKIQADRMPVCSYFQRGVCTNEHCPYLHVHVNPKAAVCEAFLKGYCPEGDKCKLQHCTPRKFNTQIERQPAKLTPEYQNNVDQLPLRPNFSNLEEEEAEEEVDPEDNVEVQQQ